MSWFSALVLFIVIWWTTLFFTLPFGVRGQHEDDEVVRGSEPGAPQVSGIKKKMLITTAITIVVFAIVATIIIFNLIDLRDFNIMPD